MDSFESKTRECYITNAGNSNLVKSTKGTDDITLDEYLKKRLHNVKIHDLSFSQQTEKDGCNYGVFVLENAKIIKDVIAQKDKVTQEDIETIKQKLEEAYPNDEDYFTRLNNKRKDFALALKSSENSESQSTKNDKFSTIFALTLAMPGFVLGITIAFYSKMLVLGIVISCCSVAASATLYYCCCPSSFLKDSTDIKKLLDLTQKK